MLYLKNESKNPFYNHALEEYILKNYNEDVFILWINSPAVLIGRNQRVENEINPAFIEAEKINIVRRLSGGGAVYNDEGNINFTLISKRVRQEKDLRAGFEKFAKPLVLALQALGLPAVFSGRNDLLIHGKKISGNAQYRYRDKILHHGTILYNLDSQRMAQALRPKKEKFQSKGVKSVRSRVANIADYMDQPMDLISFKNYLQDFIMDYYGIKEIFEISPEEEAEVLKIQRERFENPSWTYGKKDSQDDKNSIFQACQKIKLEKAFTGGNLEVSILVKNDKIEEIGFHGDFFANREIEELADLLEGASLQKEHLKERLEEINIDDYIRALTNEEFLSFLTGE